MTLSDRIAEAVADGSVILTANQRLSRALRKAFDGGRQSAGLAAWPTPAILPFSSWLRAMWSDALLAGATSAAVVLDTAREEAVWRGIIGESPEAASLLDLPGTARSAMQAWTLVHQYRVPIDGRFQAQEDWAAFAGWAATFRRTCAAGGWIDDARLPDAVRDVAAALELPRRILLAGFDEFTPQQSELLEALHAAGCAVENFAAPLSESEPAVRPSGDAAGELREAAEWARERLADPAVRSIAVVLLNLGLRRARIERIFEKAFGGGCRLFHITIPDPLAANPLVNAALLLLRLAPHSRWPLAEAGLLLRSPFTVGGLQEAPDRAVLDARLRRSRRTHVAVGSILAQSAACPALVGILERWRAMGEAFDGPRLPSAWAAVYRQVLGAAGWPGDRVLSSSEYQVFEAWLRLLETFAGLDVVSGPLSPASAIDRLAGLAADTTFQPQDPGAPVQIMGVLEAAGSRFDALWIAGATDDAWPAPAHPHPFLPLTIQKELNLPHSSPEREADFAGRTFARLRSSAPEVVVSYPRRAGDVELRPSPLLAGFPKQPAATRPPAVTIAPEIECVPDETAPPLDTTRPEGGTRLVKMQAACPFQAFAGLRLHAQPLDAPDLGLGPAARGSAIHDALRFFWDEVRDHARLTAFAADDLRGIAERAASAALDRPFRDPGRRFDQRYRDMETRRLTRVLLHQAEFEKTRSPFRATTREGDRTIALGGLELKARIDRIDELPDGRQVIIDYKTNAPSPSAWDGDRPDEPQLPLYAISNQAPVAGVVFAAVGADGPGFRGYAAAGPVLPGTKPFPAPPAEQIEEWRRVLEPLAEAFREGAAAVDPKRSGDSCTFCRLTPLCRIHEAAAVEEEVADAAE